MEKKIVRCKSCSAPIFALKNSKGKTVWCNAKPVRYDFAVEGALLVTEDGDYVRGKVSGSGMDTGYMPHYTTCPKAADFKKYSGGTP